MSEVIRSHFMAPKNIGKIKNATHTGSAKSGFCGDTIAVSALVENGVVKDAKYNVFGCHVAIATASVLSEWVRGKTTEQVASLTYNDTEELLGGEIEQGKEECVKTALRAFHDTFED